MYHCRHFKLHELVPPKVWDQRGDRGWQLLDDRILRAADDLRDRYGPITINNYGYGGNREWSGLRTPDSPFYRPFSQHTFGRALDMIFKAADVSKVRQDILSNPNDMMFAHINALEDDVEWLHIDVRNVSRIYVFHP